MNPEQFLELANLFPEACLLVDDQGGILAANRRACQQLGLSAGELTDRPLADLLESEPEDLRAYLRACMRNPDSTLGTLDFAGAGRPIRCEGALLRPAGADGSSPQVLLRLAPNPQVIQRFLAINEKVDE